jgi:hypothetical protein
VAPPPVDEGWTPVPVETAAHGSDQAAPARPAIPRVGAPVRATRRSAGEAVEAIPGHATAPARGPDEGRAPARSPDERRAPAPDRAEEDQPAPRHVDDPRAPAPDAPAPSRAPATDSLADEVAALRASRVALDRGRPAQALSILDHDDALHPQSVLREERLATRILALCAVGRPEAARVAARELERSAPGSPQWAAIDASCARRAR